MEYDVLITTYDNPFDPFKDFNRWYLEDQRLGYNSWEKVARFCSQSENMTQEEELADIEKAIDEVVMNDFTGIYRKVNRESAKELVNKRNSSNFTYDI